MRGPYPKQRPPSPGQGADVARPTIAWRLLGGIALAAIALLLVFAHGYGFHRDELYFMEAGRHPAWGYDDQPPLTPLIARGATLLFGAAPTGLRVPSALAFGVCVLLAGLTARELGARRRGQALAALCVAASGAMFIGHIVSTTTYDLLAWTVLLYLATRIIGRGERRLWLVFGLVLGIGLMNKWTVLSLAVTLVGGLVAARRLDLLRSRWFVAGMALAGLIWVPNLVWQADHGWPQRTLARQIADEDPFGTRAEFLPFQLLIISPLLAFVWISGLLWLLRSPVGRPFRAIAYAYLAFLVISLITGGKGYYAVGFYPALLGAGGVAWDARLAVRRVRTRIGAAIAVAAVISALIALPLLPASSVGDSPVAAVNEDALETIGWPRFVDWVAQTWHALPVHKRGDAVIFTANYGEAGAIQQYGPARGLPRAYSGHNSFSSFGRPPDSAGRVLVIGYPVQWLSRDFRGCRLVGRFDNRLGVDNEEQGATAALCAGPRQPWTIIWPRLHHLNA